MLTLAATYLGSTHGDFAREQCYSAQKSAFYPADVSDLGHANLDGQIMPNAPEFSASLGYQFNYPIDDNLELILMAQVNYTDEFFDSLNPDDVMIQYPYTKINTRVGISGGDGDWELAFYGKKSNR